MTELLLQLGGLVTQQLRDALEALSAGKGALARMVQRREDWVDALELEAQDRVAALLLQRQPGGLELRAMLSLGRSVRDLERIGNEAERIARAALETQARMPGVQPPRELLHDVESTAALVMELVEGGLSAIAQLDVKLDVKAAAAVPGGRVEAPDDTAALAKVQP